MIDVRYVSDTNVTGLQFDFVYNTNSLQLTSAVRGDALADHLFATNSIAPGIFRVLTISFSNAALTNGILARIGFAVSTNSTDYDESLVLSNLVAVNAASDVVPLTSSNGVLAITPSPRFSTVGLVRDGKIRVELSGTTGRTYLIEAAINLTAPAWVPVHTNSATGGIISWEEAAMTNTPVRFYRARVLK